METTADLIDRDITPIIIPWGESYRQFFAASNNTNYKKISQRLVIAKDWNEYEDLVHKLNSTGSFARIGTFPYIHTNPNETVPIKYWYRSHETIGGRYSFGVHLTNKKWPLKEVF